MKKITFFLIMASCLNCFSQDQHWQWALPILGSEGQETDKAMAVATDADNNIFVVGQFTSNTLTFPGYDYDLTNTFPTSTFESFVAKYDTSGNIIWARKISGSGADKASCIAVDSSGNFYIAGIFDSPSLTIGTNVLTNAGGNDIFIVKYDTDGNVVWAIRDGGSGDEYCNSIAVDSNGNIVIAGGYKSTTLTIGSTTLTNGANSDDDSDILIAKYDNTGNPIWAKSWNGISADMANDVAVDPSGNIVFTGYFHSPSIGDGASGLTADSNTESSIFLIKYNPSGELFWQRKWSGSLANEGRDITIDNDGGIYFIAQYQGGYISFETITIYSDVNGASTVAKYNPNGSIAWAKICANSRVRATSVAVDSSHNLYVSGNMLNGFTFGVTPTYQFELGDIAILKYNNDSSEAWGAFAGEDQGEYVFKIATDTQNNVIAPGIYVSAAVYFDEHTINHGAGVYDIFLAKLGTGVLGTDQISQNDGFIIYPNPMRSETNIYLAQSSGSSTVIIADALGREIKKYELVGKQLRIDRGNISAGNYFVKVIDANGNVEIRKLLVQ